MSEVIKKPLITKLHKEQRSTRLLKVMRLRFRKYLTEREIASKLKISTATVEKDVRIIREKMREEIAARLEFEARDIAEEFKSNHDQKLCLLWKEYDRLVNQKEDDKTMRARLDILDQITAMDNHLIEQLRKLGIISVPDENKPTVNVGVVVGDSDRKGTEGLEKELEENLATLSGTKVPPVNRL